MQIQFEPIISEQYFQLKFITNDPTDLIEPMPKIPKHRCIKGSCQKALNIIKKELSQLVDLGVIDSFSQAKTPSGTRFTMVTNVPETPLPMEEAFSSENVFFQIFVKAIPGLERLFPLAVEALTGEEFEALLESDASIDELVEKIESIAKTKLEREQTSVISQLEQGFDQLIKEGSLIKYEKDPSQSKYCLPTSQPALSREFSASFFKAMEKVPSHVELSLHFNHVDCTHFCTFEELPKTHYQPQAPDQKSTAPTEQFFEVFTELKLPSSISPPPTDLIERSFTQLSFTSKLDPKEVLLIKKADLSAPLFLEPDWISKMKQAFKEGSITENELSQFTIVHSFFSQTAPEVFEFFKRTSIAETVAFIHKMAATTYNVEELDALKSVNLNHPLFEEEEWIAKALKAFCDNQLPHDTLMPLLLIDAARRTHPSDAIRIEPLFDKMGNFNKELINGITPFLHHYLSEDEKALFFKRLEGLPKENSLILLLDEQSFLTEEKLENFLDSHQPLESFMNVAEFIYYGIDVKLFWHHNGKVMQNLVLPPALLKEFYKAKGGEDAEQPLAVTGVSKGRDFENPYTRPLYTPCRYFSPPELADGFPTDGLQFYFHDAYHILIDIHNPHKEGWIELGKVFFSLGKIKIWQQLIDRNASLYANKKGQLQQFGRELKGSELFWAVLSAACVEIVREARLGEANAACYLPILLGHIRDNQERWAEKFGITLESFDHFYDKQLECKMLEPIKEDLDELHRAFHSIIS